MTTIEDVGEFLEHHGVKGQKWGVRKDNSISSVSTKTSKLRRSPTDVVVKQKPGKFATTSGGKRQTASDDAILTAGIRQFAKKSTTDSLSNKQIQDAVTRMNLEQQYRTLVKKTNRQTRGQRFANKLVKENGKKVVAAAKTAAKAAAVGAA